jgi:hypothetical protein
MPQIIRGFNELRPASGDSTTSAPRGVVSANRAHVIPRTNVLPVISALSSHALPSEGNSIVSSEAFAPGEQTHPVAREAELDPSREVDEGTEGLTDNAQQRVVNAAEGSASDPRDLHTHSAPTPLAQFANAGTANPNRRWYRMFSASRAGSRGSNVVNSEDLAETANFSRRATTGIISSLLTDSIVSEGNQESLIHLSLEAAQRRVGTQAVFNPSAQLTEDDAEFLRGAPGLPATVASGNIMPIVRVRNVSAPDVTSF